MFAVLISEGLFGGMGDRGLGFVGFFFILKR